LVNGNKLGLVLSATDIKVLISSNTDENVDEWHETTNSTGDIYDLLISEQIIQTQCLIGLYQGT
jgi:hypothetical protein